MSGSCSGGRWNVLAVGNCCYIAICSVAEGASMHGGGEGRGHTVAAARLQLVIGQKMQFCIFSEVTKVALTCAY